LGFVLTSREGKPALYYTEESSTVSKLRNNLFAIAIAAPMSACTMVDIKVWSDEGGVVEVSGQAVTNTCLIWQSAGAMTTDCPQDQEGFASWSGSDATTSVYSLKAVADPGYTFTGWNGCDFTGSDEFSSWRVYTSDNGTTCNLDHGGNYGSYRLRLAQSEALSDLSAKFQAPPQ